MTNRITDISQRKAARVAGFGILIMMIVSPLAFLVLSNLIVPGNAAATANNIKANEWLFRFAIALSLIVIICDVVVALALYVLIKPVNKDLALLATFLYLMHCIIYAISLVFLFIEPIRYRSIFLIGQGFLWSSHLIVLGYLVFKSGYIPRILGVLLIIGGSLGFLLEGLTYFLFPNYVWVAYPGIAVGTIALLYLMLWLLLKADKIPEMKS